MPMVLLGELFNTFKLWCIYANSAHLRTVVMVNDCRVCVCSGMSERPPRPQPARLLCPWEFSGKSPGVGCHFLFQGIFLTQRTEPPSLASLTLAVRLFTTSATWEALSDCWSLAPAALCQML